MIDHRPAQRPGNTTPARSELDAFLAEIKGRTTATPGTRGRLIFALDATMSREWAWDTACTLQGEMFREVATAGGLDMQLVYYRGSLGECKASRWFPQSEPLTKAMSQIRCEAGYTQIEKVLIHAQKETKLLPVSALVFVGDAMEVARLAERIDKDGEVIETENGPKVHPAVKEELAGRAFIVRTLRALGLNLEPVRSVGRPTAWQKRQEQRGADE